MSDTNPWVVIDLMTGEALGWYPSEMKALTDCVGKFRDKATDVQFRGSAKREWR